MKFSSLFFSYSIIRLQKEKNKVIVNLPKSFFWKPATYKVSVLDSDHLPIYNHLDHIYDRTAIEHIVRDGFIFNITIYYKGWLWFKQFKNLSFRIPRRLRAVQDITMEVLEIKERIKI